MIYINIRITQSKNIEKTHLSIKVDLYHQTSHSYNCLHSSTCLKIGFGLNESHSSEVHYTLKQLGALFQGRDYLRYWNLKDKKFLKLIILDLFQHCLILLILNSQGPELLNEFGSRNGINFETDRSSFVYLGLRCPRTVKVKGRKRQCNKKRVIYSFRIAAS